jgi:hypothetical protein
MSCCLVVLGVISEPTRQPCLPNLVPFPDQRKVSKGRQKPPLRKSKDRRSWSPQQSTHFAQARGALSIKQGTVFFFADMSSWKDGAQLNHGKLVTGVHVDV